LWITHPDGNMSVYAHMDRFTGKVAEYILKKHYEKKSFELVVEIPKDLFPISQGDTIGYVGNTGGSEGPHLHFEIRDSSNLALNPLTFKFDEIKDGLAPVVQKVAFQTLDIDSRINGKFGRVEYFLMKRGNNYALGVPLQVKGRVGIEVLAFDRMDYSNFRCGINHIEVFADSEKVFSQHIEKINFLDYDDIVTMMNYSTLKTRGLRFNKLYVEDGNPFGFYEKGINKGEISISEKTSNVEISLKDTYGNESRVDFKLIPEKENSPLSITPISGPSEVEISDDVLKLQVGPCGAKSKIVVYEKGAATAIDPDYEVGGQQVFLIDLKKMIPDSAQACNGMTRFKIADQIPSNIEYSFFSDWADIRFHKNSLYDTLYLTFERNSKNGQEVFSIGKITEPLNDSVDIELKQVTQDVNDPKVAVYHVEGRHHDFIGGKWENAKLKFSTKELGDFLVLKDTIPPYIQRIYCNSHNTRFRISDNLSGIGKYEATINGEWLLMRYDYKTGALQSERLDKTTPLKGDFELKVTDRSGNEKIYRQKIF
jgi:hypothetical protein